MQKAEWGSLFGWGLVAGWQLGADKQSRSDAEFLLAHFRSAGFSDWTVVLATLLRRVEVLLDLFHDDQKLWAAYRSTMQSYGGQYNDVVLALEAELHSQPHSAGS